MTADFPFEKKTIEVLGRRMAYVDEGTGDPILFLHGNPTSSYLWRNVMPHLRGKGRLLAPDLIGMGDSEKLPDSGPTRYTFAEHAKYLYAWIDAVGVERDVTLVIHDWGSALGFNWAHLHEARVKGIAFMEGIVAPIPTWEDWPGNVREIFQAFRSPAGEAMVLEQNVFVEQVLPGAILRDLNDAERAAYRKPFAEAGEGRRPTLTWPRQIPIAGEPADVVAVVEAYGAWLAKTPLPKLFVNAEPGAIMLDPQRALVRSWPNLSEVTVKGSHFIQEDSPDEIGQAVAGWLDGL
ncbi:MAG: haloalkane dehalogenase [Pseudomonadota bacterium]